MTMRGGWRARVRRCGGRVARPVLVLGLAVGPLVTGAATGVGVTSSRASTPTHYGYDVSWPQCPVGTGVDVGGGYGKGLGLPMPPASTGFVVVGLTAGLPFTVNPCLASEVRFALTNALPRGVYTMAAYPTAAQLSTYGHAGPASGSTLAGQLYNTGYAMARHDLAALHTVALSVPWVWIDVEYRNVQNWPANNATNNRAVLSGVQRGFRDAGLGTGWYSVRTMWQAITGSWQDRAPMWKAGDYTTTGYPGALSICSTASLNGGPIWMGQRVSGSYDLDATCPALPSMVTVFDGAVPPSVSAVLASPGWAAPGATVRFTASLGTTQIWAASVVNACTGAALRSWSGVAKGTVTVDWPTASVPAGEYRFTLGSAGIARSATVELSVPGRSALAGCGAERLYGADRWATSVAVGRVAAPAATTVVVAPGSDEHLVDALVSAPLAKALGAPLLLTATTGLPASVAADIRARAATTAVVVGGPGAVSDAVVTALQQLGVSQVSRVYGADRYATSAAVAGRLAALGGVTSGVAWVGSGAAGHLVDALAADGPAAAASAPVLLTAPTYLPTSVRAALTTLRVTRTFVLGGTSAVGTAVQQQLPAPTRLAGVDRYDTAARVATAAALPGPVCLVPGVDAHLVDALPAGALGRSTVLAAPTVLPAATATWLRSAGPSLVTVVGGPAVTAPAVVVAAHAAVA